MAGKPTCRDCGREMIAARGFNAILALDPPHELDIERFTPVSVYVCGKCGQIRLYHAGPEQWENAKMEMVSYGYKVTEEGESPRSAEAKEKEEEFVPRCSRA